MRWLAILAAVLLLQGRAAAHDHWANGVTVPEWVKSSCCGQDDVHRLAESQVHPKSDGYHVDIYPEQVMGYARTLPSEDGYYWIFFKTYADGSKSPVYCFFAPPQSY